MKIKLLYLVMAVFCLSLAACSKDEDENEKEQVVEYSESDVVGTWEPTHIKGTFHFKNDKAKFDTTYTVDKDIKENEKLEFVSSNGSFGHDFFNLNFYKDYSIGFAGKKQDGCSWSFKKGIVTMAYIDSEELAPQTLKMKDKNTLIMSVDGVNEGMEELYEKYDLTYTKKK